MRTKRAIRNSLSSVFSGVIAIALGLIAQKVIIEQLGLDYLGINSLFMSIVAMLGVAELGFGAAIISNLYEPVAHHDQKKVSALLYFYRTVYRSIALAILLLAVCMLPWLHLIVGEVQVKESIYLLFALYVFDTVASYLIAYKRSLLIADQKNYVVTMVHTAYLVVMNILQLGLLILTQNFLLFLLVKIVMRIIENIVISNMTDRAYPYINKQPASKLSAELRADILQKVRALVAHKFGSFVVTGSDAIIISVFAGVAAVGLYSNYIVISGAAALLITQIFNVITANVGNLLAAKDAHHSFVVYKRIRLLNGWLATITASLLFVLADTFVSVWLGKEYVLGLGFTAILAANLYSALYRSPIGIYKEAAGIFYQDRFVPLVEAALNIALSILLLHYFGIAGVLAGTFLSTLIVHIYSYPRYVYGPLFKRSVYEYYKELLVFAGLAIASVGLAWCVATGLHQERNIVNLVIGGAAACLVPTALYIAIFRARDELQYYWLLAQRLIKKQM